MIIADTSGLLAFFNSREPAHEAALAARRTLVVSPYVIAELDYLVATRLGVAAELDLLRELAAGGYVLPDLDAEDLAVCARVIDRYRDQAIGLADASLVALADRYRSRTLSTLDRRHFEVLRPIAGGRFELLPAPG